VSWSRVRAIAYRAASGFIGGAWWWKLWPVFEMDSVDAVSGPGTAAELRASMFFVISWFGSDVPEPALVLLIERTGRR
jgi:hypothetical protein